MLTCVPYHAVAVRGCPRPRFSISVEVQSLEVHSVEVHSVEVHSSEYAYSNACYPGNSYTDLLGVIEWIRTYCQSTSFPTLPDAAEVPIAMLNASEFPYRR